MKILFISPTFANKKDEADFFEALQKVPGYKNIEEMGGHFLLELDNNLLERETVIQLASFFDRWGINKSPLETLAQMIDVETGS
jgi:hypothetical protein